jgi:hypothetical protein
VSRGVRARAWPVLGGSILRTVRGGSLRVGVAKIPGAALALALHVEVALPIVHVLRLVLGVGILRAGYRGFLRVVVVGIPGAAPPQGYAEVVA